jgi:hypothetical protein
MKLLGESKQRDVLSFPRITDPVVGKGNGSNVVIRLDHFLGKSASLGLVLVVQDEDGESGLLSGAPELLGGSIDILLQLADGVLESCACVVDLVNDENVLADHCVRVTFVPGTSSGVSVPSVSYRERPMAWMGMLGLPGFLRKERRIRAGT